MRTISQSKPVARKNYGCDACVWITESGAYLNEFNDYDFTATEEKAIATAKKNGWRVMKGEKHSQASVVDCDGVLISWRAITAIHEICLEHELYPEAEVC